MPFIGRPCAALWIAWLRVWMRALLLALLLSPALAQAQAQPQSEESRWLLMPSVVATQGDPKHPARAAARLINEDLRAHGKRAFSIEQAKELFEQHGSTPPMTASAADIDELAKDAQRALYHVASGLPQRAKKDVERALERARRALESLNRETRAAQHLLDACLYLVRAHLQHGDRAQARMQALECRRLVPDIAPEPTLHPPDVIGVLAEAQAQLRSHEPASLRIESEPMGCAAYVNGRNLGPTPRELSQLSPGEYRLQVECEAGVMGRVHRVALVNNRYVSKVDTRYDRAIESLFDLSLNYSSRDAEKKYLGRDAVETGRTIGASDVVVAWVRSPAGAPIAEVQLDRYRVSDGVHLAQATVKVDPGTSTIASALIERARAELTAQREIKPATAPVINAEPVAKAELPVTPASPQGDSAESSSRAAQVMPEVVAETSAEPQAVAEDPVDYAEPRDEDSGILPVVGYSLGAVGLAAHVASWVLYGALLDEQSRYTDALDANAMPMIPTTDELTAIRDVDSAEDPPFIAGGIGAVVSTVALPMWLPDAGDAPKLAGVPWWGWLSGGVGAVVAVTGAALTANEGSCQLDRFGTCTQPQYATHIGPMLLLQAVPFLAVPVVQAVRELSGHRASASLEVGAERAVLHVQGSL